MAQVQVHEGEDDIIDEEDKIDDLVNTYPISISLELGIYQLLSDTRAIETSVTARDRGPDSEKGTFLYVTQLGAMAGLHRGTEMREYVMRGA